MVALSDRYFELPCEQHKYARPLILSLLAIGARPLDFARSSQLLPTVIIQIAF
jgi:hypothetical protein